MKPSAAACFAAATIRFAGRVGRAIGDVVGDARAEDEGVLRHEGDSCAQRLGIEPRDVDAVEGHPPALRIVEAQSELEQRGLARPRRADDRHHLARRDARETSLSTSVLRAAGIGEADALEGEFAARRRGQRKRRRGRGDARLARRASSAMRAAAPAACDISFQTSESCPSAPAAKIASRMNCDSVPAVIRWPSTSSAPSHSTTTTLAKIEEHRRDGDDRARLQHRPRRLVGAERPPNGSAPR